MIAPEGVCWMLLRFFVVGHSILFISINLLNESEM